LISKFRDDEIPKYRKNLKKNLIIRKFARAKSVFANWKIDNEVIIDNCLKHDFTFWKVPRFCKDEKEIKNVQKVVRKYFSLLKAEHLI